MEANCKRFARQVSLQTMADNACPLILLTRSAAQSQRFADDMTAALGQRPALSIHPLMTMSVIPVDVDISRYDAVVFTSENGVSAFAKLSKEPDAALRVTAYCVGQKTAQAAQALGFMARSAEGDVTDLSALILADLPRSARVIHLHGHHQAGDLCAVLQAAGQTADHLAIYEQVALAPDSEFTSIFQSDRSVVVPLFSPRSAALFFAALPENMRADLRFVAISAATADAIPAAFHARVSVAQSPNAGAMIDALVRYLR